MDVEVLGTTEPVHAIAAWLQLVYGGRYPFADEAKVRARMMLPRGLWKAEADALEEIELAEMAHLEEEE